MLRIFRDDIADPSRFVVTLELVPGTESRGRSVDTVMGIAKDAFADGRISAVSITDNPGGNPSLSPDVLGYQIFSLGMDVIVHFTCRDMNRVGMESRALQLAMMGIKNILALTGDYSGKGFGGQGAPVFDLDSVNLTCMLAMLSERNQAAGDPEEYFVGCAVSPFKQTEGETYAQYAKMCKKVGAGARFLITQLGYDARKFAELLRVQERYHVTCPTLASLYVLSPGAARIMHQGRVPGAVVTARLLGEVSAEWEDKTAGRRAAVERAARLGVVLKGLGYRGIHIGGIHRRFETVADILDRMAALEGRWQEFLAEFDYPLPKGFYVYTRSAPGRPSVAEPPGAASRLPVIDKALFHCLAGTHRLLFTLDAPWTGIMTAVCRQLDRRRIGRLLMHLTEDPLKKVFLGCQRCGDCAIQHVAFLCPESQCPKHIRNGACGGSRGGMCEVRPERQCVWYRAYNRWVSVGQVHRMASACIPPRMWELNRTSSWLNFYVGRDHQSASTEITSFCSAATCRLPGEDPIGDLAPEGPA